MSQRIYLLIQILTFCISSAHPFPAILQTTMNERIVIVVSAEEGCGTLNTCQPKSNPSIRREVQECLFNSILLNNMFHVWLPFKIVYRVMEMSFLWQFRF